LAGLSGLSFEELHSQLEEAYHQCCEHEVSDLSADDYTDAINQMILRVWNDKGINGLDMNMVQLYFDKFWKGVTEGYGQNLSNVDYDTPDYNMLEHLKKNVYQFSGAKNYQELREISNALLNDDGTLRAFDDFKKIALTITDKYSKAYLKTEYDLAIAGGQMASKWITFAEEGDPLLEFDAVLDSQTTALCLSLNGIVKPLSDPFWKQFYPPNHFRCRSTARRVFGKQITPNSKIVAPDIPKMFRTNLAQQGLIFPEDHPYFIDAPQWVLDQSQPKP
jgi:SPP1 gp7 family putative phage head morphogenesis protein